METWATTLIHRGEQRFQVFHCTILTSGGLPAPHIFMNANKRVLDLKPSATQEDMMLLELIHVVLDPGLRVASGPQLHYLLQKYKNEFPRLQAATPYRWGLALIMHSPAPFLKNRLHQATHCRPSSFSSTVLPTSLSRSLSDFSVCRRNLNKPYLTIYVPWCKLIKAHISCENRSLTLGH